MSHDAIHRTIFADTKVGVESVADRRIAPGVGVAVATMKFGPVMIPSGQRFVPPQHPPALASGSVEDRSVIAGEQQALCPSTLEYALRSPPLSMTATSGKARLGQSLAVLLARS